MISDTASTFPWSHKDRYSERGFLRLVSRGVRDAGLQIDSDVTEQVIQRAAEVFRKDEQFITDQPSQFHLLLTSCLLAAVQVLERHTSSDQAKKIAGDAFTRNGRFAIALSMKVGLFFAKDKFDFVRRNSGDAVAKAYGEGFDMTVETDDATFLTTRVRKCGFHEFFIRHGRPELTKLMCDWDNNWSDVLNKSKRVNFTRPTTIAAGDESCAFQFKKTTR